MGLYDQAFKTIFSDKQIIIELIDLIVPESFWLDLKPQNIVLENTEFSDIKYGRKETDLLFRIKGERKEVFVFLLLEHQSSVDYLMSFRLLNYMVRIWERYIKEKENESKRKTFKLPLIIPVVFYNGLKVWDANLNFFEKVLESDKFREYVPDFKYRVIDVRRLNMERLEKRGNALAVILGIEKIEVNKVEEIKEWVKEIYQKMPEEEKELLKKYIKIALIGVTKRLGIREEEIFLEEEEEVLEMFENIVRVVRKELKEEREKARKEGMQQGIQQGIKQGIQQGMQQGKREALLKTVKALLSRKFGERIKGELSKLMKLSNDELERIIDEIFDLKYEELYDKYLKNK